MGVLYIILCLVLFTFVSLYVCTRLYTHMFEYKWKSNNSLGVSVCLHLTWGKISYYCEGKPGQLVCEESWASPASVSAQGWDYRCLLDTTSRLLWMLCYKPQASCLYIRSLTSRITSPTLFQFKTNKQTKLPFIYCLCARVHTSAHRRRHNTRR